MQHHNPSSTGGADHPGRVLPRDDQDAEDTDRKLGDLQLGVLCLYTAAALAVASILLVRRDT